MILISPAKNLNLDVESYCFTDLTEPVFLKKTNKLLGFLKKLNLSEVKKLMNVSDSLAEINFDRLRVHSTKNAVLKPAAFLFSGDTFNGLQIRTFDHTSSGLAQRKLRILSGLYGLLRPFDQISPYRLEMGTGIKYILGEQLSEFWKDDITNSINNDLIKNKSQYLFNLSSSEYFESINKKKLKSKIINFDFKKLENKSLKNIGMMIKKCRGSMAKFLLTNNIDNLAEIKKFSELGFKFHSFDESVNKFTFAKNE